MHDQIQQHFKIQQQTGQKVKLSHLRHQKKKRQKRLDEQNNINNQLQNNVLDKDIQQGSQNLYVYYCSLCGRICLLCNSQLQLMPKRRTDGSIAINFHQNFVKLNLQRDKIKYFKREHSHSHSFSQSQQNNNIIQVQYRWKCQCGIPIGYTSVNYQQFQDARQNQNLQINNKPYFYCFNDGLVQKMKDSKLISQLITYKQTILLHLKRKTKK